MPKPLSEKDLFLLDQPPICDQLPVYFEKPILPSRTSTAPAVIVAGKLRTAIFAAR